MESSETTNLSAANSSSSAADAAARRRAKILARGNDRMKLVMGEAKELPKEGICI
jgi:hypothetical protein